MERFVTILRIELNSKGKKVWVYARCDKLPSVIGTPTSYGGPDMAELFPIGAEYKKILTVPDKLDVAKEK